MKMQTRIDCQKCGAFTSTDVEGLGGVGKLCSCSIKCSDILDKEREAASKEHAKLTTMIEEFIEEDKEWHKIYAKMKAKLEAADKMAEALRQYELTLNEAADDYEGMAKVFKNHGLMTSYREATETGVYIRAIIKARKEALAAYEGVG